MIRIAIALAAALTTAEAGPAPDPVDALLAGAVDPVTYDYGQLRDRPDTWLEAAEARARRDVLRRQGVADSVSWEDANFPGCISEGDMALLKGLSSVRKVKTGAEWRIARLEADGAEARRQSVKRLILAGEASPFEQLRGPERRLKSAKEATDPVLAELYRRSAEDNLSRLSIGFSARQFMLTDVSPAALDLYDAEVSRETCAIDASNTAWIKATIAERGWFKVSRDGQRADDAARNMIQHADHDPAFQQAMLALLEKELAAKETSADGYAYLYDRVAVNTGRPQRYATQGRCAGPGDWRPDRLEDPAGVEARRASVGITWPMADYIARMNAYCR